MVMAAAVVMSAGVGADGARDPSRQRGVHGATWWSSRNGREYLLAGPTMWTEVEHPPVTAAVESAIWKSVRTDPGGTDPMVNFLLWKQSLDPTRFAHYHPKLAPVLHKIAAGPVVADVDPAGDAPRPLRAPVGSASPAPTAPVTTEPQNLIPPRQPGAEHAPDGRRDGRVGHLQGSLSPSRRVTTRSLAGTLVRPSPLVVDWTCTDRRANRTPFGRVQILSAGAGFAIATGAATAAGPASRGSRMGMMDAESRYYHHDGDRLSQQPAAHRHRVREDRRRRAGPVPPDGRRRRSTS